MQRQLLLAAVITIMVFAPGAHAQASAPTLKKVAEFDLPGPPGKRFDYLTIDPDEVLLHVSCERNRSAETTNCGSDTLVGSATIELVSAFILRRSYCPKPFVLGTMPCMVTFSLFLCREV